MFKIGDKVVCIDSYDVNNLLNKYEIYKITNIIENHSMVFLEGLSAVFSIKRFMSIKQFRKQKINKIYLKINHDHKL